MLPFKVYSWAMYDRDLSGAEMIQNYDAWLPNSAPHCPPLNITVNEDNCTRIGLINDCWDWDTVAMETWTDYYDPGTDAPRAGDVDTDLNVYLRSLPKTGMLYSDASCTTQLTAADLVEDGASSGARSGLNMEAVYFKPALHENGMNYAEFLRWPSDEAISDEGDGAYSVVTINVVRAGDRPTALGGDFYPYLGDCSQIELTANDIDGDYDIKRFNFLSLPNGTEHKGTTAVYYDAQCINAVNLSSYKVNETMDSGDSLTLWYLANDLPVVSGVALVAADSLVFSVTDVTNLNSSK
jgi:hypothetical protein